MLCLGPGTSKDNPAPSCNLLLSKYKSIPDGRYWIRDLKTEKYCGRKGKVNK